MREMGGAIGWDGVSLRSAKACDRGRDAEWQSDKKQINEALMEREWIWEPVK